MYSEVKNNYNDYIVKEELGRKLEKEIEVDVFRISVKEALGVLSVIPIIYAFAYIMLAGMKVFI